VRPKSDSEHTRRGRIVKQLVRYRLPLLRWQTKEKTARSGRENKKKESEEIGLGAIKSGHLHAHLSPRRRVGSVIKHHAAKTINRACATNLSPMPPSYCWRRLKRHFTVAAVIVSDFLTLRTGKSAAGHEKLPVHCDQQQNDFLPYKRQSSTVLNGT
jgi:hypothetical protein